MSTITLLSIICICIEEWHMIYYTVLYEKYFKRPEQVILWAQSYEKLHKHFMEFSDAYVNNLDLQYTLGLDFNKPLLGIIEMLQQFGGSYKTKHKILGMCSIKQLGLFLLQQFIEMIYWIILLVLALITPDITGAIIFVVLMILSELEKHFNKSKNCIYMNLDSLFCIGLFVMLALRFC